MPCPVTGLTSDEKRDLEHSWRLLIGTTPREFKGAGINLVLWMFDNIPNMRARFGKFQASSARTNLVADEMFLAHTQSVIITIDTLIKLLDEPRKLKSKMQAVVKSHISQHPPIGADYFEPFAARFHIYLGSALGARPHKDDVQAWEKFLYVLADMVRVEEEKQKRISKGHAHHGAPCCCIL